MQCLTIGRVLNQAGFDVVRYDQIPNWAEQVAAGFGAVLQQRNMLEAELGEAAAAATSHGGRYHD